MLEENFKDGKNLIVFDTKKEAESFSKILSFVTDNTVFPVFDSLVLSTSLVERVVGLLLRKNSFEASINWKYHTQKNTLPFERNMVITIDSLIKTLIDAGYNHSAYLAKPGSYKKDGDTISIRLPFEEKVVALNFFDTLLDEILIFDTHGQFLYKKDNIKLPILSDRRGFEEA